MKQYTKIDYSGYIPLCEHYPIKNSGFNFGDGGSDLKALGWNFWGLHLKCLLVNPTTSWLYIYFHIFKVLRFR